MLTEVHYNSLLSPTGGSRNVKAMLRVIREGESNQLDEGPHSGYRARYHPERRVFYEGPLKGAGHPRIFELLPDGSGRRSSAFGAYQFTATTWDYVGTKYNLADDISEWSQDCHALALIYDVGALDDVLAGRFLEAVQKCGQHWASLPDSRLIDGGSKVKWMTAEQVWKAHGGGVPHIVAESPLDRTTPAPVEDRSTQARPEDVERINATETPPEEERMAPAFFLVPLLQSLFEAFTPLLRAKVTKAIDKQVGDPAMSSQVVDRLMAIVQNAAGTVTQASPGVAASVATVPEPDPVVAIATVKQDQRLLDQVEAEVTSYLDQIAPMLDRLEKYDQQAWAASEASMDSAAERSKGVSNDDWMARALVIGILGASGLLVLFVGGVAIAQIATLTTRTPTTEVWAAITGIIGTVLGILGTVFAYRFGTNRQSAAKDFTNASLADMASRRGLNGSRS